jgi:hypothetical protein
MGARRFATVFAIVLGWAGLNGLWWYWNSTPPAWDQTDYLLTSIKFFDTFRDGGYSKLLHVFFKTTSGFGRPPLLSLLPFPNYVLAGPGTKVAHLALLVFIPLLLLPLYGTGTRIGGEAAGLAACLVAATMPLMVGLSRQYFVEFPLAAVVTATVYILFRLWEKEALWLYGALSVAVAAGLMLKVTYVVFVAPPLLVLAVLMIRQGRLQQFLALGAATSLGLALAAFWYVPNLHRVLWDVHESGYGIEATPYGYGGPGLFLGRLAYGGLSIYYTVLLAALALTLRRSFTPLWRTVKSERMLLLVSWVVVPLLVFLSAKGRDPRFFLPALPAVALALGTFIGGRRKEGRTRFSLLFFPVVATLVISFVPLSAFPQAKKPVATRIYQALGSSFQNPPLGREDWKTEEIVKLVLRLGRKGTHPVRTVVLANHPQFHVNLFNYVARLNRKPITFSVCENTTKPFSLERCFDQVIMGSDFLLDKTGRRRVAGPDRYGAVLDSWISDGCLPYNPAPADVRLPDGSSVRIWRRSELAQLGLNACYAPKRLLSISGNKITRSLNNK